MPTKIDTSTDKTFGTSFRDLHVLKGGSEWKLPSVSIFSVLPFIVVALFTSGISGASGLTLYAILVSGVGYFILSVTGLSTSLPINALFGPAAGVLVVSAITALWVRLGFPVGWSIALWLALFVAGFLKAWRERSSWLRTTVPYGRSLVLLSSIICVVYFLPSARNDLVFGKDGSFKWMFIDSQHFHAIAASVKDSGSPPKTPGTATAELLYHFAPYAPAAAISRVTSLEVGDAVARVTRGVSLWALALSSFGLGVLLSMRATGSLFGGIASAAGLFFYGSIFAMFTNETTTLGHQAKALFFNIPRVQVPADGGPFNQLLGGHSMLHGLIAITVTMGMALAANNRRSASTILQEIVLITLPALTVPTNIEVSLYCFAVVSTLLFWGRLNTGRAWGLFFAMAALFVASWAAMGYSHSQDAGLVTLNRALAEQWWIVVVWLIGGLGLRLIAFSWISRPTRDPIAFLLLISVVGWLAFALLFHLRDENQRYGAYFLQSIFSIFAFSRLTPQWWRRTEHPKIVARWLSIVRNSLVVLLTSALILRAGIHFMHGSSWIASLRLQILPLLIVVLLIFGALELWRRKAEVFIAISGVVSCVLLVGFLGWIPTWIRFGLQTVPTSVSYSPEEVQGLRQLRKLMPSGQRFATNKHTIDRMPPLSPLKLSYGYSSLSEHPVLLEGYLARGENSLPWFGTLLEDNELLFTTRDPDTLRGIAKKWDVKWLVARPNSDISIPKPVPSWLVEQQGTGSLKIYRID